MGITVDDTIRNGFQNTVPMNSTYETTNEDVVHEPEISTEDGTLRFIDIIIQNYRQNFSPIPIIVDTEREEGEIIDEDTTQKEHEYDSDHDSFKYF